MTSQTTNKFFVVQREIKDRQVSDGLLSGILWRFLTGPFIKRFFFGVFGIIAIIIHGITGLNLVVSIILFCGFIVLADVRGFFRKLKEWIGVDTCLVDERVEYRALPPFGVVEFADRARSTYMLASGYIDRTHQAGPSAEERPP